MDNLHNDERISAYLDGELSADEQTRFEERLAESAELRQLVEELRALRGSLDLLPRHRLEADFADHVLRRAEREVLTAGDGASGSGPTEGVGHAVRAAVSPEHAARPATGESRNWKRRALRPLIYSAIAIAAAVLIMVFNPPRDKDVAQVGDNAKPTRLPEGAGVSSNQSGNGTVAGAAGEANRPTADSRKELESLADRKDSPAAHGGRADFSDDSDRRSGGQAELAKQSGTPAGAPAGKLKDGEETSKASNLAQSLGRSEQGQAKGQLSAEQDATKATTPAGALPNQVARDRAGQGINLQLKIEAGGVEKTPSSGRESDFAETPVPASIANGPVETGKGQANGIPSSGFAANGRNPAKEVLQRSDIASTGMVVANCIASPEATDHAFLGLLAKNHIVMGTPSDGALTTYSAALDRLAKKPAESADNDQLVRSGGQAAEAKRSLGEIEKAKDNPGDVEVIYVEGTADQITSLVNDLRAEPEVFRSLTVAPAPTFPIASYAYDGGFAKDHRPIELQFGAAEDGRKPAARDAELHESLREREFFRAATKNETPPPVPAKAPAGNELSDRSTSDEKSIEGLGAKLAATDKTTKDQLKQLEPAMKPAENGTPNVSAQIRSLAPKAPVEEKAPPLSVTASPAPAGPFSSSRQTPLRSSSSHGPADWRCPA